MPSDSRRLRLDFARHNSEFPNCQKSKLLSRSSPQTGGEGRHRTAKYENQKSCFFLCLEFPFSEQNGEIQPEKVTRKIAGKKVCIINHLYFLAERGGLYCSFFCNSLVFCHFIRKTRIFCCLRPGLSSLIRLSNALLSLLWTSKASRKSNMSNKPRTPLSQPRTKFFERQGSDGILRLVLILDRVKFGQHALMQDSRN